MRETLSESIFYLKTGKTGVTLAGIWLLILVLITAFAEMIPFPYRPNELDLLQAYTAPFSNRSHWLGTDQFGRDVAVNLIYGIRTAVLISYPVITFSTILGVLAGLTAGFFGNRKLKISNAGILGSFIFILSSWFYGFYLQKPFWEEDLMAGLFRSSVALIACGLFCYLFTKLLKFAPKLNKHYFFPLDRLVLQLIELITSLPVLLLIIAFAAFTKQSVGVVLAVIFLTYWAVPARLVRAEVLKTSKLPYTETLVVMGVSAKSIIFKHLLPNTLHVVVVAFAFGVASLMALEATLSFLGIGIPADVPSWGRMIKGFRENMEAWWLLVFPGVLLIFSVLSVQTLSHWFVKKLRS